MVEDRETPEVTPHFETSDVEANLAVEQGLGIGARELAAQREAGDVTPGAETEEAEDTDVDGDDGSDSLKRSTAIQGDPSI